VSEIQCTFELSVTKIVVLVTEETTEFDYEKSLKSLVYSYPEEKITNYFLLSKFLQFFHWKSSRIKIIKNSEI